MKANQIEFTESGSIIIGDAVFEKTEKNKIENRSTDTKAFLVECNDEDEINKLITIESEIISIEKEERGFRNIMCSKVLEEKVYFDEKSKYYLFNEIQKDYNDCTILSDSLARKDFSIYSRIIAAMNLTESLSILQKYYGTLLFSFDVEKILVNCGTGDVYINIGAFIDHYEEEKKFNDFGFPPDWYFRDNKDIQETDLRFFLAYSIFRLLCTDDPFDGSETLLKFPILTEEAKQAIRKDKYDFALIKGKNFVSEYIGQGLWQKWRMFPSFIRHEFEQCFIKGKEDPEERPCVQEWLKNLQKLRDCIVYVNGRIKFCDPDISNKIQFLIIDDYKIPVWQKKAIYWYHVALPYEQTKKGIVAGIVNVNGKHHLRNYLNEALPVTVGSSTLMLKPDSNFEITEGIIITINNKEVTVVNGLVSDSSKLINAKILPLKNVLDSANVKCQTINLNQNSQEDDNPQDIDTNECIVGKE